MITFGPGESCEIANMSANCLSLIQCMTLTATRCISGMAALAPPTASSDSTANSENKVQSGFSFMRSPLEPGKHDGERRQPNEHVRQRPMHDGDADESKDRDRRRRIPSLHEHRRRHLGDRGDQKPGGRGGNGGEDVAERVDVAIELIECAENDDDDERRPNQSDERHGGPWRAAET